MYTMRKTYLPALGMAAAMMLASATHAATVSATGTNVDGKEIAASATFEFDTDMVWITLTNLTEHTFSAAELLTRLSFELDGGLSGGMLSAATADAIKVVGPDGVIQMLGNVDLMTAHNSGPTWEMAQNSNPYLLSFNPDAKYGIIGAQEGDKSQEDSI